MNNEQIVCTVIHPEYSNFSLDSKLINCEQDCNDILEHYVDNLKMKPGVVEILKYEFELLVNGFDFPNKEKQEYIKFSCEDFGCSEDSLSDNLKNKIESSFIKESIFMGNEKYHCILNVYYNGKVYIFKCA